MEENTKVSTIEETTEIKKKNPLWNNAYFCYGITSFLVLAGAILFYFLIFHTGTLRAGLSRISTILKPVFVGFVIAYLMTPVMNYIENNIILVIARKLSKNNDVSKKKVRSFSVIFTTILGIALVYGMIYLLVSQIVPSVSSIIANFDTYTENVTNWANKLIDNNPELSQNVSVIITKYSDQISQWVQTNVLSKSAGVIKVLSASVVGVLTGLWNFVIGFIISIYLLSSKEKFIGQFKKIIFSFLPRENANKFIKGMYFTHKTFIGFIGGKVIDSIIIGLLCLIGTTILQTPYAALVSLIIGVTNVIPFFGPYLGAIPTLFLIFVVDPLHPANALYFLIFVLLLQQFDGNILGPKILGDSTGLAGFWVLFSITLFGGLFGIFGMVIGVPVFAVIYAAIKTRVNTNLSKKELSTKTEEYVYINEISENGTFILETEETKETEENEQTKKESFSTIKKLFSRKKKNK